MKPFACILGFLLMYGFGIAQKLGTKPSLAVFQAALLHPPLAIYLNPKAAADQGLCILNNGRVPVHYKLSQFGRPLMQYSEATLRDNQHFHYLIFTHASQWGDSARVEFQARLARMEVQLDLQKIGKDWEVTQMELIQLP